MSVVREIVAAAFRFSGLPGLVRAVFVRHRATIVFYHDPRPEVLDRHLRYLSKHYRYITLDRLVDAIRAKDWSGIPRHALVVTIDDGHRGNAALAHVFARHQARPTLYLCSQIVATNRNFWFKLPGVHAQPLKALPHEQRLT